MNAPASFGRLTLVDPDIGRTGDGHRIALWLCSCGSHAELAFSRVKTGAAKSCGCLKRERLSAAARTHGGHGSPEYSSWMSMRRRCESPSDKDYPRYGAKGITVYAAWSKSFAAFLTDVGKRPSGTSLDRIDTRLGYQPGNVRWATAQEQGRNRRGTFAWHIKGRTFQSITDAAAAFSVSEHTVSRWVNGAFDKRRGKSTAPRADCCVTARYAQ